MKCQVLELLALLASVARSVMRNTELLESNTALASAAWSHFKDNYRTFTNSSFVARPNDASGLKSSESCSGGSRGEDGISDMEV